MFRPNAFMLSIRGYGALEAPHRHDHSQLVLPLSGSLCIDISGQSAQLDRRLAAYVDRHSPHAQESRGTNQFLIVDVEPGHLDPHVAEYLASYRFMSLAPEANHLIDYMGGMLTNGRVPESRVQLWAPLLLDALTGEGAQPRSRLAGLMAAIESDPFLDWTTEFMAQQAGMSVSRLHAVFRSERDTTPHAWLARLRLGRVQHWLATTTLPIAEIAYRGRYADQSALTRAMRKATGLTPSAFRQQSQESGPKERES
ncbi:helix-turn-helix transcriptional regulator [Dickeya fangzhongdai]|uniref:helix-turn-helix transcriptional regulator n=1 Tax=Dickeya fangzhongdai TaxID=1778540 RepID=UPI0026DF11C3|nr:AraC family transcriptional regulator [Dickeya fangzhongdai]WKV51445.1 AraC family transcriptional regulator [Dickeya fangzhongdai]